MLVDIKNFMVCELKRFAIKHHTFQVRTFVSILQYFNTRPKMCVLCALIAVCESDIEGHIQCVSLSTVISVGTYMGACVGTLTDYANTQTNKPTGV